MKLSKKNYDKCLIFNRLFKIRVKIIFGVDTKTLFAKYWLDIWLHLLKQIFSEGQKSFFLTQAHLRNLWQITFILVFLTNYPISNEILMDVIFGYPLIREFGTTWQALKTYFLTYAWYFTFIQ